MLSNWKLNTFYLGTYEIYVLHYDIKSSPTLVIKSIFIFCNNLFVIKEMSFFLSIRILLSYKLSIFVSDSIKT